MPPCLLLNAWAVLFLVLHLLGVDVLLASALALPCRVRYRSQATTCEISSGSVSSAHSENLVRALFSVVPSERLINGRGPSSAALTRLRRAFHLIPPSQRRKVPPAIQRMSLSRLRRQ